MEKILSLMLCIGILLLFGGCRSAALAPFTSFSYSETSSVMNGGFHYSAVKEDGKTTVSIRMSGMPEEDTLVFATELPVMERLYEIAQTYKINRWNGFNKASKMAMDGTSFRLSVYMENGAGIEAKGFMTWPKNYDAASEAIASLFEEVCATAADSEQ